MQNQTAAAPMIEFRGVAVAYSDGRRALDGVSARIARSSFVALVGGSGAGKTTMLKTVNRLIEPTSGDVEVDGRSVRAQDAADLRRRIGYVFQGLGLFPHMSVGENIGVTPSLLGWPSPKTAARIEELLALVNLPADYARVAPTALSGGQRQRVAIARALAANPPVMLMDEPFGALDPLNRDEISRAYRAIHDELGLTTMMVTHDIQEALLLADRIIVLSNGNIIADGSPGELAVRGQPADVTAMLDMPRRQAQRIRALMNGDDRPRDA